jgi:multidrug efflux pump subunit AcrA (membrane-fusion protein)
MYNSAVQLSGLVLTAALVLSLTACSRAQTAQASKRDGDPKPVSITVVHKNAVARAVDVVGTLAAVDQVTVSSEADGSMRTSEIGSVPGRC